MTIRALGLLALGLVFTPLSAHAAMDIYPGARLRMLDKVTARTSTFDVQVDKTVRFGQLYIRPRACRKSPPIEAPESASFLEIWEVTPQDKPEWIFSGWMFASSPALSSMDHPIYDVWVLDCVGEGTPDPSSAPPPAPPPPAIPADNVQSAPAQVQPAISGDPAAAMAPAATPSSPVTDDMPVAETPPPSTEEDPGSTVAPAPAPAEPPVEDYEAEPSSVDGPVY